ncbi:MarR family winged helix-turn-helix transcriptional regulator [Bacteriovorax sp. Seq25_V]|uniref:MarR family winged helix-turn-helix transcriptional regulator n=1 Tax=Bacteriovorax sp. Seq25_V TaxID=1201288 RepID=UPI00038A3592|nr:MarR family transcriptional regulator [Bacteriovorax sp. Seq25_V]EQC46243.1 MarR family protein [Bacteriovorax sp. Seq25_V]
MSNEEHLKIDNQLCFSLYRLSKFITSKYKDFLDSIELTYPQYLVMLVLWEDNKVNMSTLGHKLSLDNGTLTPLVKRLIEKGLVEKKRCQADERIVYIAATDKGIELKKKALEIPSKMMCSSDLDIEKLSELKKQIDNLYLQWNGECKNGKHE